MFKVPLILIAFLYASSVAAQQTADKGTLSLTQTAEEITAVAIPMEMAGEVILDSANYHKAVVIGIEPARPGQLVEVTAPAHERREGEITKDEIKTEAINVEVHTIEITDHVQPVEPKH
jgi:hypothetical protein